ncbi:hypothetical protein CRE_30503 [Caenorhabditis remanei]|uniref:Sdz-33 F-box domain-containing protein n=1 Tax=Caenorhabditis remanei TaxID=31234 RepID=E3NI77_CAERE|nr:hypothetical protein CRE_30503 [Caenorhabditis remanei]
MNSQSSVYRFLPLKKSSKLWIQSKYRCNLFQSDEKNDVDEHTAYLLENLKVNDELNLHLHIRNYNFDGKFPRNSKKLYLPNSHWIGYEKLLDIDCKFLILRNDRITNEEWNSFIKKWMTMETNQNLEYLELDHRDLDIFRDRVLYDIPHEMVDGGVKRILKIRFNQTQAISGGIDIRRIDGKTATFFVNLTSPIQFFAMSIH